MLILLRYVSTCLVASLCCILACAVISKSEQVSTTHLRYYCVPRNVVRNSTSSLQMCAFCLHPSVLSNTEDHVPHWPYLVRTRLSKYMDSFGELCAKLRKLPKSNKRKREDVSNPLTEYVRALLLPCVYSQTTPVLPFKCVYETENYKQYDVTGNPPLSKLFVYTNGQYEFE